MSESEIGIRGHLSGECRGIGGKLKTFPDDFIVEEIPIEISEDPAGRYTMAIVRARNWETNRLVRQLSRTLGISRKRIYFAGTKDKRAITTQAMVFDAPLEDVISLRIKDLAILRAYRVSRPIYLGDLIGNRFHVTVRDIMDRAEEDAECTGRIIERWHGFPNFFGVQRFGSVRPITHVVGKMLIKREYRRAVETYLGNPSEMEGRESYEARKFFQESGDVVESLKIFPKNLSFERAMLSYLAEHPGDYSGAISVLPENLARMFIHAYQSYLFNRILSRRLELGLDIREGDLVMEVDKGIIIERDIIRVREHNLERIRKRAKEGKTVATGMIVGSELNFAAGIQGEIEKEILGEEGLDVKNFIFSDLKFLSSRGGRRALISPVNDLHISSENSVFYASFWLPKGCYATSFLREFMKVDDLRAYG